MEYNVPKAAYTTQPCASPNLFVSTACRSTMIEFVELLIISITQGISEFLPISSSGHNAVMNHFFERFGEPLAENDTEFLKLNILLHVGSLFAILIVFRKRVIDMFVKDFHLIPMLVVTTIPAVIVGYPIHKFAPWIEEYLPLISGGFVFTGILLLASSRYTEGEKTISTMTWRDALLIGCSQALAILPGISRSGTTIVTGLLCRLKREEAAAFSFILAIPVIIGGGLLEFFDMFKDSVVNASSIPFGLLLVGSLASCLIGIIALVFLLNWLKKGKLWYFALWVFAMALFTLMLFLTS